MRDFGRIAATLRASLVEYYRVTGESVSLGGWHNTLETNSGYVERRSRPLVDLFLAASGRRSLLEVDAIDVGCGFGAMSVFLAAGGATVLAFDPNARRMAVGRETAEVHRLPVTWVHTRMEEIDAPDEAFDLAILNNTLCYVVDEEARTQALAEVRRVLRPGGHVVLRNPNRLAIRDQFTGLPLVHRLPPRAADRVARLLGRRRSAVRLHSPRGARRELRRAGFTDVRSEIASDTLLPAVLHRFASYQHLVAMRPASTVRRS